MFQRASGKLPGGPELEGSATEVLSPRNQVAPVGCLSIRVENQTDRVTSSVAIDIEETCPATTVDLNLAGQTHWPALGVRVLKKITAGVSPDTGLVTKHPAHDQVQNAIAIQVHHPNRAPPVGFRIAG